MIMGQAKQRGTFEQRKQQAIDRREALIVANRPAEQAKIKREILNQRRPSRLQAVALLAATLHH